MTRQCLNTNVVALDAPVLRLAAVGLGRRAQLALLAHRPAERLVLAAGVDPRPEARDAFAQREPKAELFADLDDLLKRQDIDAVFLTSPDHLHEEQAIAAMEAGKAVFLEKPMAITVESCDRIIATAQRTGQKLYVGHNMRHFPVMQKMKRLIDDGAIGEPKAAWCRHFVSYGGDAYFKDWHAQRCCTTGLLLQKGAHDIDILHWLGGGYSQTVTAMGGLTVYDRVHDRRDADAYGDASFHASNWPPLKQTGLNPVIDIEDLSMMLMRFDNGLFASYQQCHFTPDSTRNYTIIGTEGRIENDGDLPGNATVKLWNTRRDCRCEPDHAFVIDEENGGHGGADPRIIDDFINHLRLGTPAETSWLDARMAVAAGCAATESLRDGGSPKTVARPTQANMD